MPDVETALAKAESLGGTRIMGPEKVMEQVELGLFKAHGPPRRRGQGRVLGGHPPGR